MKILVTLEQRFKKKDGLIFANDIFNYAFFRRYLSAFDEVVVLARVTDAEDQLPDTHRSDGPQVRFIEIPYFVGPFQYFKKRRQVLKIVSQAVQQTDAFMLRIPGLMGTLIWKQLRKKKIPYGVEVVGDPWDSIGKAIGRSLLNFFLSIDAYRKMKKQCVNAAVAAYVTQRTLQNRYPSTGWTTHYSSIELPQEQVLNDCQLTKRLHYASQPFENKRPFRICHTGTMDALYKSQDTLIEAVSMCIQNGLDIKLFLMGDGRYRSVFEQKVKELQLLKKVHFLGMIPYSQVRDCLDESDLFVLPSLTEGLPRVLIEAMSRGLPCLASCVGGNPELLDDGNLFQAKNTQELAQKITQCLSDYDFICQMIRDNLQKAEQYTSERLIPLRNECYQKLREITAKYWKLV